MKWMTMQDFGEFLDEWSREAAMTPTELYNAIALESPPKRRYAALRESPPPPAVNSPEFSQKKETP